MKHRFFFMLALLLSLSAGARAIAPGDVPVQDYIRLHVLAEDDSDAAQALKLQVRDAILEQTRALLADCPTPEEAWAMLGENLDALEAVAAERAEALGFTGDVRAELGVFDFPDRRYGDVLVPAGEYRALRVVIGAGEGHNWWCVLYPSLCLEPEPTGFHSVILDWLKGLFGRAGR